MGNTVTVVGGDRAAARLTEIGERAAHQRETFAIEGRRVQRSITGIARDTGRLMRGTTGRSAESVLVVDDEGYVIGTDVPYAPFVYHGTRYMAARPPKVPPTAGRDAAAAVSADLERSR